MPPPSDVAVSAGRGRNGTLFLFIAASILPSLPSFHLVSLYVTAVAPAHDSRRLPPTATASAPPLLHLPILAELNQLLPLLLLPCPPFFHLSPLRTLFPFLLLLLLRGQVTQVY